MLPLSLTFTETGDPNCAHCIPERSTSFLDIHILLKIFHLGNFGRGLPKKIRFLAHWTFHDNYWDLDYISVFLESSPKWVNQPEEQPELPFTERKTLFWTLLLFLFFYKTREAYSRISQMTVSWGTLGSWILRSL